MLKKYLKRILYRLRGDHTTEILIKRGMKVGQNFKRLHGVILDPAHCWLISIGNNVTMAPRVHILAHDASTKTFLGYTIIGRVKIGNNVFIGAETVVLPNVTIGDNVVVGANSTVSKSLASNGVYAGSPAKFICSLEEYLERNSELMKSNPKYDESFIIGNITKENKAKMIKDLNDKIGYII